MKICFVAKFYARFLSCHGWTWRKFNCLHFMNETIEQKELYTTCSHPCSGIYCNNFKQFMRQGKIFYIIIQISWNNFDIHMQNCMST